MSPPARRTRRLPRIPNCRINGKTCDECGIVHGQEAEELRLAVEKLITGYNGYLAGEQVDPSDVAEDLQRVLDDVDARDALAYVNAKVKKRRRA